ncbi:unnamed protein product [Menidia menidia]|uniref:(Atlantic silverside) hypothetical protein n=1 Tax=Menidia menidia TaxID=238744 RepID=A0A8S4BDT7_9TELE|nr:unnamed protein product [Menidia menidia]
MSAGRATSKGPGCGHEEPGDGSGDSWEAKWPRVGLENKVGPENKVSPGSDGWYAAEGSIDWKEESDSKPGERGGSEEPGGDPLKEAECEPSSETSVKMMDGCEVGREPAQSSVTAFLGKHRFDKVPCKGPVSFGSKACRDAIEQPTTSPSISTTREMQHSIALKHTGKHMDTTQESGQKHILRMKLCTRSRLLMLPPNIRGFFLSTSKRRPHPKSKGDCHRLGGGLFSVTFHTPEQKHERESFAWRNNKMAEIINTLTTLVCLFGD